MMRLVMLICFLPIPVIMAVMRINETKFKKNIVIGVTLPYEAREDAEVSKTLSDFKRSIIILAVLSTAALLLCFLAEGESDFIEALMCWLLPAVVLPAIPYVIFNRKLMRLKRSRGWGFENPDTITVDTKTVPRLRWISPLWFLLAFAVSLLPLIRDRELVLLYIIDSFCILSFWLAYRFLYRNKSEKLDGNISLTETLSRVRKQNWGRMWIISAWAMAALNIGIFLLAEQPIGLTVFILAVSLVIIAAAVGVEMGTRRAQERLTEDSGKGIYLDEDDKWIWGMFYYNPSDFKCFVNERVGTGMTVNLARPAGKLLAMLSLIILLSLPFIFPITNTVLNKPPLMETDSETLKVSSGGTEYMIELESIKSAQLMDELPEKLVKISGTGMENLLKGRFSSEDTGRVTVCLDPEAGPFILLVTQSGEKYLLGTREPEKTEEIFKLIK